MIADGLQVVCLAALLAVPASGQPLGESLTAHQRVFYPEGDGQFPAVVAVPGCSGVSLDGTGTDEGRPGDEADRLFRRHYARMATRLVEAGFAVILVDYLSAEGVANTCGGEISHQRVGEYVGASLDYARTLARVDASRLSVIGWSHGGAGVIAWLQTLEGPGDSTAAGAIAVYPECLSRGPWSAGIPVLILLAEADDIALPERCDAILGRLPDGTNLQVERYVGARHGFDFTEGPEVLSIGGGMTVGRNQAQGDRAWREIFAFLRSH